MRYLPSKIESKWQKIWIEKGIYEPDLKRARKPFYNLMMFPYPSAEGLHVGNMYAFTGADIYGRFRRMRGFDVLEPIGLDGFGIHSENYAIKIGKHPADQAKISEKNFYRQLAMIGNSFAWKERLETYNPEYYRWTQWIFVQMFKHGLAYRKKAPVNWCLSCKTVLADEQVVGGECERCGTKAIKKELEQWFFKITDYAGRLLESLDRIDWSEKIKIAQKNWIGKSEGALIKFPISNFQFPIKDYNFVFIHGYKGSSRAVFWPWLKREIEKRGGSVFASDLPNPNVPKIDEQVSFLLSNHRFNEKTIIVTHSLGGVVAMELLPVLKSKIHRLYMVAPPLRTKFLDKKRRLPLETACDWKFDFEKIKHAAEEIIVLADEFDHVVPPDQPAEIAQRLSAKYKLVKAAETHFKGLAEPEVLNEIFPAVEVFTTRPDTLFGATYMVLAPEHPMIKNFQNPPTRRIPGLRPSDAKTLASDSILNFQEVENYLEKTKNKSEAERIVEGREKTGVELKGIKAINPANNEEIPVWIADYVLGHVGTGAIMAVPAHDQRDFEFAQKFNLPIKMVVCPHYPAKTCPVLDRAHEGGGHLVDSGQFNGMPSEGAKNKITEFVGGKKKIQYRLRDWLISRQRYWGPPVPLIFCTKCKKLMENSKFKIQISKLSKGELENPGWIAVAEKDLPVKLPYIKNFRPTGTEKSPLALVEKFYKVRCPKCGGWGKRETDVSDTFLDSAWYYIGYLMKFENWAESQPLGLRRAKPGNSPSGRILKIGNSALSKITRRWLPVDMYIGGAEHAVLHLLYVRFMAMALHDLGLLHFEEPFKKFRAHGLLIKDGAKMSKSRGNVVNPDEYIKAYGADALRMYLMFLGPFKQGGDFRDTGIRGITRFLERVWKLIFNFQFSISKEKPKTKNQKPKLQFKIQNDLKRKLYQSIKKITEDTESLQYNTAISALMVLLNEFETRQEELTKEGVETFLKLLAPFAPHIAEELFQQFFVSSKTQVPKKFRSIHTEKWPVYDSKLIREETFELVIQVNGKVRGKIKLAVGATELEAKKAAVGLESIKQYLKTEPRKIIFIPNKLINFVM